MPSKKFVLIGILIFSFIITGIAVYRFKGDDDFSQLKLGDEVFYVEEVATELDRSKGLSGRTTLGKNKGMIFLFDKLDYQGFWMKDMHFPIDIIWIKGDSIIGWQKYAKPDDSPNREVYYSSQPVDRVLEVASGTVDRLKLEIGDRIFY